MAKRTTAANRTAVMDKVRRWRDATGKHVMVAFNITDEHEAMLRHADLVAREGGSCVMVSLVAKPVCDTSFCSF